MKLILEICFILSIMSIIIILNSDKKGKPKYHKNYYNKKNDNNYYNYNTNYKEYYYPKIYITTLNELKFYKVLIEIAQELNLILFSQVSLYSIIRPKNLTEEEHKKYFDLIKARSIDFVLVDKNTCRIKLCIELDDSTHKRKDRLERDKFINKLFKDLEINLLRYPIYPVYYKETLKRKIEENMKNHYYVQ